MVLRSFRNTGNRETDVDNSVVARIRNSNGVAIEIVANIGRIVHVGGDGDRGACEGAVVGGYASWRPAGKVKCSVSSFANTIDIGKSSGGQHGDAGVCKIHGFYLSTGTPVNKYKPWIGSVVGVIDDAVWGGTCVGDHDVESSGLGVKPINSFVGKVSDE